MAQVLPGPLISTIAGSIGGQTFQRGASGLQVRTKPLPRLRQSAYTQARRQFMEWLTRVYGLLSPSDLASWEALALSTTWYDRFGNVITGKGYWAFLRCNFNLWLCDEAFISTAATPAAIAPIVGLGASVSVIGTFDVHWTATDPTPGSEVWLVYASTPWSAGRAQPFGLTRFIAKFRPTTGSPQDIFAAWSSRLHPTLLAGKVVYLSVVPVDIGSGWAGAPATAIAAIT